MRTLPIIYGYMDGGASISPPPAFLRPFTLPFELAKASYDLQSIDAIDERRLENVRILTKLASGGSGTPASANSKNDRTSGNGVADTIGNVAQEVAKRRLALARIGVRFGGAMASVQAERLRDRASSADRHSDRNVAQLAELLALNGAERLEVLSEAIHSFDDELGKRLK